MFLLFISMKIITYLFIIDVNLLKVWLTRKSPAILPAIPETQIVH